MEHFNDKYKINLINNESLDLHIVIYVTLIIYKK